MSAPITEAHVFTTAKVGKLYIVNEDTEAAQAIADSEARATAALRAAIALGQQNCDDAYDDLRAERKDAIARAESAEREVKRLNGCCEKLHTIIDTHGYPAGVDYAKMEARAERAEAEVQRLKADGAASAFVDMACRASRAETEVERLRSDRDCEKRLRKDADEFRENAIARAERAEAELAAERGKLDWVFENYVVEAKDFRRGNRYVYYLDNREDLIVEMKGDAK